MTRQKKRTRKTLFEGLPVVDASKDVVLHIKKCDIDGSKKKDPLNCAAARAGKREFGTEVKVFLSRMYVKNSKNWVRYLTPNNAAREIVSFDRGSAFIPGEYLFKRASPGQQLGHYASNRDKKTGTHSNKRRHRHITEDVRISAKESYGK